LIDLWVSLTLHLCFPPDVIAIPPRPRPVLMAFIEGEPPLSPGIIAYKNSSIGALKPFVVISSELYSILIDFFISIRVTLISRLRMPTDTFGLKELHVKDAKIFSHSYKLFCQIRFSSWLRTGNCMA
jgi:hypothetical protein